MEHLPRKLVAKVDAERRATFLRLDEQLLSALKAIQVVRVKGIDAQSPVTLSSSYAVDTFAEIPAPAFERGR